MLPFLGKVVIHTATIRLILIISATAKLYWKSMQNRFDYGKNLAKPLNRALICFYECDSMTANTEFFLSNVRYKVIIDQEQKHDTDMISDSS